MKKRLLLAAAIVLVAIPLAFMLRDVARQVLLTRILRTAGDARALFESLPQTWLWTVLVVIALFIAVRSLIGRSVAHLPPEESGEDGLGRIAAVTKQVQRAREAEFSRRSLARDVRVLALDVLAHQRRSTSKLLFHKLREGTLDVPPEILDYLSVERWPAHRGSSHLLSRLWPRLFSRARPNRPDPELEKVIQFMEAQLEGRSWPQENAKIGGIE